MSNGVDPPPFGPASVRKCVRITQRIQNHDAPHEVLILTSIQMSVDHVLDDLDTPDEENDSETDIDVSDTSSSTEDREEDGDGGEQEQQQQQQSFRLEAFLVSWDDPIHEKCHEGGRYNLPDYVAVVYPARKLQKDDIGWIETGEAVVIKAVSWECIQAWRNVTSEDFVKEVKTLNYLSDELHGRLFEDTHVLTANTVMYNDSHLYVVMPKGKDLCKLIARRTRLTEDESRCYFKHILKGLETLQLVKICHRDLSPENVIILENRCLIIDFGMCLRIPYSTDVRHLITPQTQCGKLQHMSPEIYMKRPFDGHAVDIWAAGTILLFMLTGIRRKIPERFSNPHLMERILGYCANLGISNEAIDLLNQILRLDPTTRLTLRQICAHPWVTQHT